MVSKPKAQKPDTSELPHYKEMREDLKENNGQPWYTRLLTFQNAVLVMLLLLMILSFGAFYTGLRGLAERRAAQLESLQRTEGAVELLLEEINSSTEMNTDEIERNRQLLEEILAELRGGS